MDLQEAFNILYCKAKEVNDLTELNKRRPHFTTVNKLGDARKELVKLLNDFKPLATLKDE